MNLFTWLNGEPQTEVERAISILNKQKVANTFALTKDVTTCTHFLIGNIKRSFLWKKANFVYYDVKFSKTGNEAMISKKGSVDFFFASKEEVDMLREAILTRFK